MKNCILFIAAFLITATISAQIINIPDGTFRNRLITAYTVDNDGDGFIDDNADVNNDGEIDVNEALAVTMMDVSVPYNAGWTPITTLEGIQYFTNLEYLNFENHTVTAVDLSALTVLNSIDCSRNELTSLDFITNPNSLETLDCSLNPFITVDLSSYINLKNLSIAACNSLTSLDVSALTNLEFLNYSFNSQLSSLNLENQTNLQELHCSFNQIANFDFLSNLNQLKLLRCNSNLLAEINISNLINLEELICSNNQLTSIDLTNNLNLTKLDCSDNQLTELELIPVPNLISLNCSNNQLTELNVSHLTHLYEVDFQNNMLTSFDTNGINSIGFVFGGNNQLTTVNLKDGSSYDYWAFYEYHAGYSFGNNPLEFICVDNFGYEAAHLSAYNTSSYCTFVPGGDYNTVQGQTFFDTNGDGCDETDLILPNLVYTISDGSLSGSVISNDLGEYAFYLGENTYTFYPVLENPSYFNINPPSQSVSFPTDSSPFLQNFCVTPNGVFNDLEISIIPLELARPGFDTNYSVLYKNNGNTILSGNINFSFEDDVMEFLMSTPVNESGVPDLLQWSFTDLAPFESREINLTMNLNAPTETPPLNDGDVLSFLSIISASETDETPEDNTFELSQNVVNSFDPNDKTCLEGDYITPEMVGDYVHYMIRFENTGSAEAVNIVVKDHIDTSTFDLSSLVPLHASHDYFAKIKDTATDHYVEFIFENINLPFDDANNDGYIVFKIKTLDTLVLDDIIENEAEIYFDFNFPIITNTAQTTVGTLSIENFKLGSSISIYPNPVQDVLNIRSKQTIETISIFDISGRLIQQINVIGNQNTISITTENLASSVYFVTVETQQNAYTTKLVKK